MKNDILLIQLWIGEIPDYFRYHLKTTENLNVDFLFITDQDINIKYGNYSIFKKTKDEIIELINGKLGVNLNNIENRNFTNLKPALADLFESYVKEYKYFGFYDIDVLFGDLEKFLLPHIEHYDVISFGNEKFCNRISGPFAIIKNTENNRKLYQLELQSLISRLNNYGVDAFDEIEYNKIVKNNLKCKILFDVCNSDVNNGKTHYDAEWNGGKVYRNNTEKMLHHFYDKKNTNLRYIGNSIISEHKKPFYEDFFWVTYFTKNYEQILEGLIESIKKYSNRKCIFYTVNYDSDLRYKLDEQFIFRRIDIQKGTIDNQGRDNQIISLKPKILLDTLRYKSCEKFVFIDTDIYLTVNCDNIVNYFKDLENYPLFNSHIHDRILANDIGDSGEWKSPIDILSEATNIPVVIFPRRKTNFILYDKKSEWFFNEQVEIYEKYKDTKEGIFRLHDEDSANIILSKYRLHKSLPLIDMEESNNINMDKFNSYSYNMTDISSKVRLPEVDNDIMCFHGFKNDFYREIESNYGKTVLDKQDMILKYENDTVFVVKNNFFIDKQIEKEVNILIIDENNNLVYSLNNQKLFDFWTFYVSNLNFERQKITVEIKEKKSDRVVYRNLLQT